MNYSITCPCRRRFATQLVIHDQGHKVKYSNCDNAAAHCPISLKFCKTLTMAQPTHYKCSRSKVNVKGLLHSVSSTTQHGKTGCDERSFTVQQRVAPGLHGGRQTRPGGPASARRPSHTCRRHSTTRRPLRPRTKIYALRERI